MDFTGRWGDRGKDGLHQQRQRTDPCMIHSFARIMILMALGVTSNKFKDQLANISSNEMDRKSRDRRHFGGRLDKEAFEFEMQKMIEVLIIDNSKNGGC